MNFINYLFTYAKSVSTMMLFLLIPVALFLTSSMNIGINMGLKIKASWLKGLKYVPQQNYSISNQQRLF